MGLPFLGFRGVLEDCVRGIGLAWVVTLRSILSRSVRGIVPRVGEGGSWVDGLRESGTVCEMVRKVGVKHGKSVIRF